MVNTVLTSAFTTPFSVDSGDVFYIAPSGSLTLTSGTVPAIATASTASSGISVLVDGRISVLTFQEAINLQRALETETGNFTVTIGETGIIRSIAGFSNDAILLVGRLGAVFNAGEIFSEGGGVEVRGEGSSVSNTGTIVAEGTAVLVTGASSKIVNAGLVRAVSGLIASGNDASIENHGTLEVMPISNTTGTNAVSLGNFDSARFVNTGLVSGYNVNGLSVSSFQTNAVVEVRNSGLITTNATAVSVNLATGGQLDLTNSGRISGTNNGITTGASLGFIINQATGVIESSAGAAVLANAALNLTNYGDVQGTGQAGRGIQLLANAALSSITNHGSITSAFANAIDASAIVAGGAVFLTNSGTVSGNYSGSGAVDVIRTTGTMDLISTGNGGDSITNTGLVTGPILAGDGLDRVINRGDVLGNIDMGIGDDTLDNRTGRIEGDVELGLGDDRFDNRGGTSFGTISGGVGRDTFFVSAATPDLIDGGADFDNLSYQFGPAIVLALDGSFDNAGGALGDEIAGIERVYGSNSGSDRIRGDANSNHLYGMSGNDRLDGAAGSDTMVGGIGTDTLTGGLGVDTFTYLTDGEAGDIITDFSAVSGNDDRFRLFAAGFDSDLVSGTSATATNFASRTDNVALDSDDRFIFRTTDQTLWFDADGNGATAAILLADLQAGAVVVAADILIA